jgi:acetyl-CoA carboxylase biotin carboxylase subunit
MVTGIDIVEQQLRIARGEVLAFSQSDITEHGHALECRINAEDPHDFVPSPGRITRWEAPGGPGVRFDSHVRTGDLVSPHYDSMIAKLVTHGASRGQALARMRVALDDMVVEGIRTNLPLHRDLLQDPMVIVGGVDNHHLERLLAARSLA